MAASAALRCVAMSQALHASVVPSSQPQSQSSHGVVASCARVQVGGSCTDSSFLGCSRVSVGRRQAASKRMVTRMAPDEEKMTKRSPLDFPVEWERPGPGRRPDIFPQFSPLKPPLPQPPPADPPYEEEEDEERKDPEIDPDKDPDQPPPEE
ncbi:unnamed protein product [Closterium sp. NIES-65]|nr:unnamed protein product [Closterium sp. NIES-65]